MPSTDDALVYRSTARALVRCSRKGCRQTRRVDFATVTELRAYQGRPHERRYVETSRGNASYRDRYDLARILTNGFQCAGCGGTRFDFNIIRGSFSEAVKCGPRCTGAVGPSCECACGGENHGAGHAAL
jgi:hypothetical protein